MLPPLSPGRMVSRDYRFQRMALALAGLRILVGFLWLSNLLWKLPPDFGRDEPRGFHHYLEVASQHAIGPLQDLTTSVLLPHDTASGWLVFAVELTAGVLFLLGYRIQIAALLGTGQAVAIAALVGLAPGEWRWGYLMLIALNAVPLIAPTTLRLSVDAALGRV